MSRQSGNGATRRDVILGVSTLAASGLVRRAMAQAPAPAGAPIRIGCITSLSGAQELDGRPILVGAQIAADQINKAGGVNGRPIQVIERDDKADPNQGLTVARELTGNGVNMLCGIITSPTALAISAIMEPSNSILMTCAAGSDRLTHDAWNRHYFRVTDNPPMRNRAEAKVMAQHYPDIETWAAIIPDVEYGRSAWAAFKDGLQEYYPSIAKKQPKIIDPILTRFGAADFKPQISQLMSSPAEGLFIAVYGGDAVTLLQQARPYGLQKKFKALCDSSNEWSVPHALGRATPENLWGGFHWYFGGYQDTKLGRALYEDYVARTGDKWPLGFLNEGHSAVYAYAAAIKKAGSTDTMPVIEALEGLTFDTAKGSVTFRKEDHQAICDVNILHLAPSDADPGFKVAEFIRIDGHYVIEPATPGKAISYRSNG